MLLVGLMMMKVGVLGNLYCLRMVVVGLGRVG